MNTKHKKIQLMTKLLFIIALFLSAGVATADQTVVLKVVDQNLQQIPDSRIIVLSQTVITGNNISLPEGFHSFTVAPGVTGLSGTNLLCRTEIREVTAATTEIVFEWITADVAVQLRNQIGADVADSRFQVVGSTHFDMGEVVALPITDQSIYPTLEGVLKDGYGFILRPGVTGQPGSHFLWRHTENNQEVTSSTTEIIFEWITADVTFYLRDQNGADIDNSVIQIAGAPFPAGESVTMPITDENIYPTLSGGFKDGYGAYLRPGILGVQGSHYLIRATENNREVTTNTTEIIFEWITADVTLHLQDQTGADITYSMFQIFGAPFTNDAPITLPITDENIYPTLSGDFKDGYFFKFGLSPVAQQGSHWLWRWTEPDREVTTTTTDIFFEWIQHQCALELRDVSYQPVPGSTVVLPSPFPPHLPGELVTIPVNDVATYPSITGRFVGGYPITVIPGDIAPTSDTIPLTMLASGEFDPATFEIDGNTYRLGCGNLGSPVEIVAGSLTADPLVVQIGQTVFFEAEITGGIGQIDALWNYDDGTNDSLQDVTSPGPLVAAHTYYSSSVYTVELYLSDSSHTVMDDIMVVVYDPSGGFVTGAGWIDSPAGAYAPDPSAAGKANFGFVSRYKKGATTPTGNTEFVFNAANLQFNSSSYDWLVVNQAGSNAQFKGTGTISGLGDYRFMLWAGDAPDTFRIRIWDEDEEGNEFDVYDNGFDQGIGGGAIMIHTN